MDGREESFEPDCSTTPGAAMQFSGNRQGARLGALLSYLYRFHGSLSIFVSTF